MSDRTSFGSIEGAPAQTLVQQYFDLIYQKVRSEYFEGKGGLGFDKPVACPYQAA